MSLPATPPTSTSSSEAYTHSTHGTRCLPALIVPALAEASRGESPLSESGVSAFHTMPEPVLPPEFPEKLINFPEPNPTLTCGDWWDWSSGNTTLISGSPKLSPRDSHRWGRPFERETELGVVSPELKAECFAGCRSYLVCVQLHHTGYSDRQGCGVGMVRHLACVHGCARYHTCLFHMSTRASKLDWWPVCTVC